MEPRGSFQRRYVIEGSRWFDVNCRTSPEEISAVYFRKTSDEAAIQRIKRIQAFKVISFHVQRCTSFDKIRPASTRWEPPYKTGPPVLQGIALIQFCALIRSAARKWQRNRKERRTIFCRKCSTVSMESHELALSNAKLQRVECTTRSWPESQPPPPDPCLSTKNFRKARSDRPQAFLGDSTEKARLLPR